MEISIKDLEWKVDKVEYKSKLIITKSLTAMSEKKYNWFQKKMWKIFFNVDVEKNIKIKILE